LSFEAQQISSHGFTNFTSNTISYEIETSENSQASVIWRWTEIHTGNYIIKLIFYASTKVVVIA